jgi:membrane protein DedA with SNARE-associated domain
MHALTQFFIDLLHHAGYGGLFAAMTLANIGAPVGSEIVLPGAGLLAAQGYLSSVWLAIAVAVVAELTGQTASYAIGRFGGRPFIARFGKYMRFHEKELDRVHGFFERYGRFAIFICRFVPVIRGIVGIAAGIAEMPLLAFYLWTFLGSTLFCGGLIWAGYALREHSAAVLGPIGKYTLIAAAVVVLAVIAIVKFKRKSEQPA